MDVVKRAFCAPSEFHNKAKFITLEVDYNS